MGTVFRFIADKALVPENPDNPKRKCDVCGQNDPAYRVFGKALVQRSKKQVSVDAACESCLKSGQVAQVKRSEVEETIRDYLKRFHKGKKKPFIDSRTDAMLKDLTTMPCYLPPFHQRLDWPCCCGELTEYQGRPVDDQSLMVVPDCLHWESGSVEDVGGINFQGWGEATDVPADTGVFRCLSCNRLYFVFQPT
jgi:hypothetical protein